MAGAAKKKETLKRLGFYGELARYVLLGVLTVSALVTVMLVFSWWSGVYALVLMVFLVGYATLRFGMFLELTVRQWLVVVPLFLAGYVGSFVYLLYRACRYHRRPPPPPPPVKAEDDPRYLPAEDSISLNWTQHGKGGGA